MRVRKVPPNERMWPNAIRNGEKANPRKVEKVRVAVKERCAF